MFSVQLGRCLPWDPNMRRTYSPLTSVVYSVHPDKSIRSSRPWTGEFKHSNTPISWPSFITKLPRTRPLKYPRATSHSLAAQYRPGCMILSLAVYRHYTLETKDSCGLSKVGFHCSCPIFLLMILKVTLRVTWSKQTNHLQKNYHPIIWPSGSTIILRPRVLVIMIAPV